MKHFTTEHEARAAVNEVLKKYPEAVVNEIHIDSDTEHNWYIAIFAPQPYKRLLFRCKWSSPIIRFK